jgi:hypothetical protein
MTPQERTKPKGRGSLHQVQGSVKGPPPKFDQGLTEVPGHNCDSPEAGGETTGTTGEAKRSPGSRAHRQRCTEQLRQRSHRRALMQGFSFLMEFWSRTPDSLVSKIGVIRVPSQDINGKVRRVMRGLRMAVGSTPALSQIRLDAGAQRVLCHRPHSRWWRRRPELRPCSRTLSECGRFCGPQVQ